MESHPLILHISRHHSERIVWDIVPSPLFPVIRGIPWLRKHNPLVNWATGSVTFRAPSMRSLLTVLGIVEHALPDKYREFMDVFEKKGTDALPPHRPHDTPWGAITLWAPV